MITDDSSMMVQCAGAGDGASANENDLDNDDNGDLDEARQMINDSDNDKMINT